MSSIKVYNGMITSHEIARINNVGIPIAKVKRKP